uniref:Putative secreted protein n=1 Tax=Anopheles triannulatus TaxID=58253 RepID=A0A2M4B7T3_9DIPT
MHEVASLCVLLEGCGEARANTTRRREAANRSDEIQSSSGRNHGFGVRGALTLSSPSIIVYPTFAMKTGAGTGS